MHILLRDMQNLLRGLLVPLDKVVILLRDMDSLTEGILLRDLGAKLLRDMAHPDLSLFANFVGLIGIIWNLVNIMRNVNCVKVLIM